MFPNLSRWLGELGDRIRARGGLGRGFAGMIVAGVAIIVASAATIGFGQVRRTVNIRSVTCRAWLVGLIARISTMSVPATKTFDDPVTTITRTSSSRISSSTASATWVLTAMLSALRRSGRSMVSCHTPSETRAVLTTGAGSGVPGTGRLTALTVPRAGPPPGLF